MTTAETTTPLPATPRMSRRFRLILTGLAVAGLGAIIALAVLLAGQGSQISALQHQVATAQSQAATAQHKADQASSAAAAVGKTQADATNANLGVCVQVDYGSAGYVQSTTVTSPIRSSGGAVSCQVGSFTPVAPQAQPPGS